MKKENVKQPELGTAGSGNRKRSSVQELELLSDQCRLNVLHMIEAGGHGHVGGALSCIDAVTALYFYKMNVRPQNPAWEERDRFILSAGHKCLAQYAVLAERGYFDKSVLDTYGAFGSRLPGHPNMHELPGIEANTGALGHGLAIGLGMALGFRKEHKSCRTYVLMGDGELAEGSNWEAAAAAAHFGADGLTLLVDNNGLQISGRVDEIMNFMPVDKKFRAFGWAVKEIDGNKMEDIVHALDQLPLEPGKPSLIVLHTVKGKGMSFAENQVGYHFWSPGRKELEEGILEVEDSIKRLRQKCGNVTVNLDCSERKSNE